MNDDTRDVSPPVFSEKFYTGYRSPSNQVYGFKSTEGLIYRNIDVRQY